MKAINTFLYTCVFILLSVSASVAQTETANYTVTFQGTWSDMTHPIANFPSNAHWSDLVGVTHNSNVVFVGAGLFATLGIENVAEGGIDDDFNEEIQNAITAGNAHISIDQPFDVFSPTSSASVSITADKDFPLLSLASMIAPSPDWMIQVNSLSLLDNNGNWIPSITMDLFPYDAGTEEGDTYSFNNPETIPQEPISSLQNIAPFSNEKVGTLTVSLVSLGVDDIAEKTPIYISTDVATKSIQIYNTSNTRIQQIEIYDAFGNRIKQSRSSTNETREVISLPSVKSGLYFIKLRSENGTITKKVVF
ncbi:spondin domain-containing protein [Kordia sp.]|uniref:spondin domain-containing protein n=1 Tax=Kordia sp. TaxID=1965332 RepID=UPI003B59EB70